MNIWQWSHSQASIIKIRYYIVFLNIK